MSLASQGWRLPLPSLNHLEGQGSGTVGCGGFEEGYRIPFSSPPLLSRVPLPITSYSPNSIKRKTLHGEVLSLIEKEAVELVPPSQGY